MTEAELLELFELTAANAFAAFTMYLSVMIAYFVTAYFVGNKLSFAQVVLASGLFIFSAFASTGGTIMAIARGAGYVNAAKALSDSIYQTPFWWAYSGSNFWVYFLLITCSVGVILGLYFMWSVRHPKAE
jgi:hypothetical protein